MSITTPFPFPDTTNSLLSFNSMWGVESVDTPNDPVSLPIVQFDEFLHRFDMEHYSYSSREFRPTEFLTILFYERL